MATNTATRRKGEYLITPERQAVITLLGDSTPLTIEEVAVLANKGSATINRWVAKGLLRRTKIEGSSFYLLRDLKRMLSGVEVAP